MSQNQNEKESGGQEPKTDSNSDFISESLVELLKKKKKTKKKTGACTSCTQIKILQIKDKTLFKKRKNKLPHSGASDTR